MVIGGNIKGMTQPWSTELVFQPPTNDDGSMFLHYAYLTYSVSYKYLVSTARQRKKNKRTKKKKKETKTVFFPETTEIVAQTLEYLFLNDLITFYIIIENGNHIDALGITSSQTFTRKLRVQATLPKILQQINQYLHQFWLEKKKKSDHIRNNIADFIVVLIEKNRSE